MAVTQLLKLISTDDGANASASTFFYKKDWWGCQGFPSVSVQECGGWWLPFTSSHPRAPCGPLAIFTGPSEHAAAARLPHLPSVLTPWAAFVPGGGAVLSGTIVSEVFIVRFTWPQCAGWVSGITFRSLMSLNDPKMSILKNILKMCSNEEYNAARCLAQWPLVTQSK